MPTISKHKFNAFAGYARDPFTQVFYEEVEWFEYAGGRILGILVRDRVDGDYAGATFAKDKMGRFRAIKTTYPFEVSRHRARVQLRRNMEELGMLPDTAHYQGDEKGEPLNFFEIKKNSKSLHTSFLLLQNDIGYSAARKIIEPMMNWFEDVDNNFIQQFQTTAFDARIWELYLYSAFRQMGFSFDRSFESPDFICTGPHGKFCLEAVTVNPTQGEKGSVIASPLINTEKELSLFLKEYMPIKFGSALTAKLKKKYWELPHVKETSFLLAIEDFSGEGSMIFTRSSLSLYLYGIDHDWKRDDNDQLIITPRKVECHTWENKVIPSGFFNLPESENISAVLFSNSGTISKFNRMGVLAGFGAEEVTIERIGLQLDHDPNASQALKFHHFINDPNYDETWEQGLEVYHNPIARLPLDKRWLPGVAHFVLLPDGNIKHYTPEFHPLMSITHNTVIVPSAKK